MDNKISVFFILAFVLSVSLSHITMAQVVATTADPTLEQTTMLVAEQQTEDQTPALVTQEGAEALNQTPVHNSEGKQLPPCTKLDVETVSEVDPTTGLRTVTVHLRDPKKCYPANLLYLGLSAGSLFTEGGSVLFVHRNNEKNRPVYQVELEHDQNSFVNTNTIGLGINIGRSGFFVGPKVGTLTVHNYLLNGSPSFNFMVAGLDVGIYHAWGKEKRLITGLKISSLFVPDPNSPVITLEGRGFVAFRIFGK